MNSEKNNIFLSTKALTQLIMFIGLAAFSMAILQQKTAIAFVIALLPTVALAIGYGLIKPRFIYLLYATYAFFFTTISRYLLLNQLSAGLEAILYFGLASLCFLSIYKKGIISWSNAFNILTISYIPWIIFTVIQFSNPGLNSDGLFYGIRIWIIRTFLLYIFLSVLSNTYKTLRIGLDLISLFTLLAFIKLLWQKYVGFDYAEKYWLYVGGGSATHLISSGIRYFSYFTDSANFGCFMAAASLVYGIIGFNYPKGNKRFYYLFIAAISLLSMFMSGTRGALIIPLTGAMLYCLLCKNIRIFVITSLAGLFFYSFFAFTNIGNGNEYIRRARTAFSHKDDASMNVRIRNREEIAEYIARHPFGVGIAGAIQKRWLMPDGTYQDSTIPPDSFFVYIWIQTGPIGLALYVLTCAIVVIGGSLIVLFKIRNPLIKNIMAAFTCGTFGIWVSGYTGNNPGMPPTDFIIPAMMAFVMNGATIDKEFTQKKLLTTKTNNAI